MKIAALALLAALANALPASAQSPAIWSVSDGDTKIYLFGTVHSLDEGPEWFTGDIAGAYRAADEVVLEALIADEAATREAGLKYAATDVHLRDRLPKPQAKALEAVLAGADAKKSALDACDPWFANIIIGTIAMKDSPLKGYLSVDATLRDAAKRDGKTLVSLESPDEQFAAFDSVPIAAQVKQLESSLDDPATVRESAEEIVRCWRIADLTCVKAASDRGVGALSEVRDAVLVRRNERWAEWIGERMKRPGIVLLAVGVEHFVGDGSLLDVLARRGLRTDRLTTKARQP